MCYLTLFTTNHVMEEMIVSLSLASSRKRNRTEVRRQRAVGRNRMSPDGRGTAQGNSRKIQSTTTTTTTTPTRTRKDHSLSPEWYAFLWYATHKLRKTQQWIWTLRKVKHQLKLAGNSSVAQFTTHNVNSSRGPTGRMHDFNDFYSVCRVPRVGFHA